MAYLPHIFDPSIFCDSTCFSEDETEEELPLLPPPPTSGKLSISMPTPNIFPVLPAAHSLSALSYPSIFEDYLKTEIPLAFKAPDGTDTRAPSTPFLSPPPVLEKCSRPLDTGYIHSFLQDSRKTVVAKMEWVKRVVFPNHKMPDQFIDAGLLDLPLLWTSSEGQPKALQAPAGPKEVNIKQWLLNIKNTLALAHNLDAPSLNAGVNRTFDCSTATKPPVGSYILRKPDISIVPVRTLQSNIHHNIAFNWRQVDSFIEVTSTASQEDIVRQLTVKAAVIFDAQPRRRFVPALVFFNPNANRQFSFLFAIIDRAGVVHTPITPLLSYTSIDLLRIIYGLCFANPETLGIDPSMGVDPVTGEVTTITVEGRDPLTNGTIRRTYLVVKLLHSSPILYSRGTRVWIVKDLSGRYFIIKDSWLLDESMSSEISFMTHIQQLIAQSKGGHLFQHSCPHYELGQDVVFKTKLIHSPFDTAQSRTQRRIVTGPIGDPITAFRSKHEFVAVMLDIVNCMYPTVLTMLILTAF